MRAARVPVLAKIAKEQLVMRCRDRRHGEERGELAAGEEVLDASAASEAHGHGTEGALVVGMGAPTRGAGVQVRETRREIEAHESIAGRSCDLADEHVARAPAIVAIVLDEQQVGRGGVAHQPSQCLRPVRDDPEAGGIRVPAERRAPWPAEARFGEHMQRLVEAAVAQVVDRALERQLGARGRDHRDGEILAHAQPHGSSQLPVAAMRFMAARSQGMSSPPPHSPRLLPLTILALGRSISPHVHAPRPPLPLAAATPTLQRPHVRRAEPPLSTERPEPRLGLDT